MEQALIHRRAAGPRLIGALAALALLGAQALWAQSDAPPDATPQAAFADRLVDAALERTRHLVLYDGAYQVIEYPGGDVSPLKGVCTDVVIRSYRALGIDLQKRVHEDMKAHFSLYPSRRIWGLAAPDTNIDHRRVPNLRVFFARHGQSLPVTDNPADYAPGDLVTWRLSNGRPHIGIVTGHKTRAGTPRIVHNIGWGPRLEDMLFDYEITGHYRYAPL